MRHPARCRMRGNSVSDIAQHVAVSGRVEIEDLDWNLARTYGLPEREVENATERSTKVRAGARLKAKLEDFAQTMMAKMMPKRFVALWMFWGALQECLTMQAYEEVIRSTQHPVLAEMFKRIAKQERRHFAYYFNQARERLPDNPRAQRFCRFIAQRFYSPVGAGVKSEGEAAALVARLFPGKRIFDVMSYIERRMAQLPGMQGLDACTKWA